jgi:hypothetical protein
MRVAGTSSPSVASEYRPGDPGFFFVSVSSVDSELSSGDRDVELILACLSSSTGRSSDVDKAYQAPAGCLS